LVVWTILALLVVNIAVPRLGQIRTAADNRYFKLIKLKKSAFLFTGPGMRDVAESGIAIPILITQLIGYAAALTVTLVTVVLYLCKVPENTLCIVIFVITGVNFLQTIIITLAFERVSVLRKRRNYKPKK